MLIWLRHPQHGVKDCYSEADALECGKNGWVRFERDAADHAPTEKEDAQPMPKKRGPKPKIKGQ